MAKISVLEGKGRSVFFIFLIKDKNLYSVAFFVTKVLFLIGGVIK